MSRPDQKPAYKPQKLKNSLIFDEFDIPGMVTAARARARQRPHDPLAIDDVREIQIFLMYFGQLLEADSAKRLQRLLNTSKLAVRENLPQGSGTHPQAPDDDGNQLTGRDIADGCAAGERQWPDVAAAILDSFALGDAERQSVLTGDDDAIPALIRDQNALSARDESVQADGRADSARESDLLFAEWGGEYLALLEGGPTALERGAASTALAVARIRWARRSMRTLARWKAGRQLPYGLLPLYVHEAVPLIEAAVQVGLQSKASWLEQAPELGWPTEARMVMLRAAVEHAFEVWRVKCKPLREMAGASLRLPIEAAYASLDDEPLLILGASGTGKELMAQAVHKLSTRRESEMRTINLGTLSGSLAVSQLFGHVKGAYTGANSERRGLFHEANGSTLFLDELDKAPREVHAMLLRVLLDGKVQRLGDDGPGQPVDVRVIAATSAPITQLHGNGLILPDLAFRFQKRINLPTLTERTDGDWQALWSSLTLKAAEKFEIDERRRKAFGTIGLRSVRKLRGRPGGWPGNVRELENLAHEYVKCNRYRLLTRFPLDQFVDLLVPDEHGGPGPWPEAALAHGEQMLTADMGLDAVVRDYREKLVDLVIARHRKDAAPKVLGMTLVAFKKMMTRAKSARAAAPHSGQEGEQR